MNSYHDGNQLQVLHCNIGLLFMQEYFCTKENLQEENKPGISYIESFYKKSLVVHKPHIYPLSK